MFLYDRHFPSVDGNKKKPSSQYNFSEYQTKTEMHDFVHKKPRWFAGIWFPSLGMSNTVHFKSIKIVFYVCAGVCVNFSLSISMSSFRSHLITVFECYIDLLLKCDSIHWMLLNIQIVHWSFFFIFFINHMWGTKKTVKSLNTEKIKTWVHFRSTFLWCDHNVYELNFQYLLIKTITPQKFWIGRNL